MSTERYLVQVAHEPETMACARAVEVFLRSGSHFLSHADWGCKDGEHKAWLVIEADSKEEALRVVPPAFRTRTKILRLNSFSLGEIEDILRHHGSAGARGPGKEAQAPNSAGVSASR